MFDKLKRKFKSQGDSSPIANDITTEVSAVDLTDNDDVPSSKPVNLSDLQAIYPDDIQLLLQLGATDDVLSSIAQLFELTNEYLDVAKAYSEFTNGNTVQVLCLDSSNEPELSPTKSVIADVIIDDSIPKINHEGQLTLISAKLIDSIYHSDSEICKDISMDSQEDMLPKLCDVAIAAVSGGLTKRYLKNLYHNSRSFDRQIEFLQLANTASKAGQELLDPDRLIQLYARPLNVAEQIKSSELLEQEYTAPFTVFRNELDDPSELIGLAIVDVFSYTKSLPDSILDRVVLPGYLSGLGVGEKRVALQACIFGNIARTEQMADCSNGEQIIEEFISSPLFQNEECDEEIQAANHGATRAERKFTLIRRISEANSLVGKTLAEKHSRMYQELVSTTDIQGTWNQTLQLARNILQSTRADLEGSADEATTLRVLAVENIVSSLLKDNLGLDGGPNDQLLKPIHATIGQAVIDAQETEKANQLSELFSLIANIEEAYDTSGKRLRAIPNGIDKRLAILNITENGNDESVFKRGQAQQLVGLIVALEECPNKIDGLVDDIRNLKQLWVQVSKLDSKSKTRTGLIKTIDILSEWHESLTKDKLTHLRKKDTGYFKIDDLHRLASLISSLAPNQNPENDEVETYQDDQTLDEQAENQDYRRIAEEFSSVLRIEAFPPGVKAEDLLNDLGYISAGYNGEPIEWERIEQLVILRAELEKGGLEVDTYRLMQASWHPLPHYVLDVKGSNGHIAVVESPIYGNATYIIADDDWKEIVEYPKRIVRDVWDGHAKVHNTDSKGYSDHRGRVKYTVLANL